MPNRRITRDVDVDSNQPTPLFQPKAICEAHLTECGLAYTILKPRILIELWIGAVVGIL